MNIFKYPISFILDNPLIFNFVRSVVAGEQENTKKFVKKTLIRYKAKTVLDIGCGTGDFVDVVAKNSKYLGIDFNKKFIDFANSEYGKKKNVRFLVQDVTDKNFYDKKKFDAVILISMLHHLSDKELNQVLPVAKKVAKKTVIIADIIPDPPGFLRKLMVKLDQGKFVRSKEEKIKVVSKYFKVIETEIIPSRLAIQLGIVCEV